MYGVDALYQPALIELGGDAVEGLTISAFFSMDNPDPAVQEFVEAFRAKYDSDPATYHAYAYDATMCIVEAEGQRPRPGEDQRISDHPHWRKWRQRRQ